MTDIREFVARLTDALNEESDALSKGEFKKAAGLVGRKRELADRFSELSNGVQAVDQPIKLALVRLAKAQKRNEQVLDAVRTGLEQASCRILEVSRRSAEVGVYGQDGAKVQFDDPAPTARSRTA